MDGWWECRVLGGIGGEGAGEEVDQDTSLFFPSSFLQALWVMMLKFRV